MQLIYARSRSRAVLSVAGAGLLLVACASGGQPAAGPPTFAPLVTAAPADLVGLVPVAWVRARALPDGALDVEFPLRADDCERLARVDVAERPDEVAVTVVVGTPGPRPRGCDSGTEIRRVRVTLAEPVGKRRVFDGARGGKSSAPVDAHHE